MRLFIALDIENSIRERLQRFMDGIRGFAPDARWVRPESLHVTLKFIGEQPVQGVEKINQALATVSGTRLELAFAGYGFFPTTKAARVFWVGIQSGQELATLAASIDTSMHQLGIPKEEHAFSPHLTLARGNSGSPRWKKEDAPTLKFSRLQEKLASMPAPEFGTMTSHEFHLFESTLSPGGTKYSKLRSFALL